MPDASTATLEKESYSVASFPDLRTLGLEASAPGNEPCVNSGVMHDMDDLTEDIAALRPVESTFSLSKAAKLVTVAFAESNPAFYAIPRNKYAMRLAVTPIPTSSRWLNKDCSKMWIDIRLAPEQVYLTKIAPVLFSLHINPSSTGAIKRQVKNFSSTHALWHTSLGVFQAQAYIVVTSRAGSVLQAKTLNAVRSATDEAFFLPGADRSLVKSILTPDVRSLEVQDGKWIGHQVAGYDLSKKTFDFPSPDKIEAALAKAPNGRLLVSPDRRSTIVLAPLNMKRNGLTLDVRITANQLQTSLTQLNEKFSSVATFEGAILIGETGANALSCDSRAADCAP